jgi:two-component system LytT family response regulator
MTGEKLECRARDDDRKTEEKINMETKITALLIDDEENARVVLRNLLNDFFSEIDVIGEASNVDEAYSIIKERSPDLVFLDIQMPRSTGFTLLKKFEEVPFDVVFVTSYDKYAINAIKFSALDYLLKPVEVADLRDAVHKAKRSIALKEKKSIQIINLLHNIGEEGGDKKVAVHSGESVKLLGGNTICYIEAEGSYCNITTTDGGRYTTAKFLKDFEEYFGGNSDFVRIHKSCMLNVKHIKQYNKGEPCIIEMTNGQTFEVARRKKQEVLEKLKK